MEPQELQKGTRLLCLSACSFVCTDLLYLHRSVSYSVSPTDSLQTLYKFITLCVNFKKDLQSQGFNVTLPGWKFKKNTRKIDSQSLQIKPFDIQHRLPVFIFHFLSFICLYHAYIFIVSMEITKLKQHWNDTYSLDHSSKTKAFRYCRVFL